MINVYSIVSTSTMIGKSVEAKFEIAGQAHTLLVLVAKREETLIYTSTYKLYIIY